MTVLETRARNRHQHSPRIRRLAAEAGVPLTALTGTGPGGRVVAADVQRAIAAIEPDVAAAMPAQRGLPDDAASGVLHQTPGCSTAVVEVDVTSAVSAAGLVPLVAKATIEVLRAQPELNATRDTSNQLNTHAQQHLGVSRDTDHGLVVGVIRDAGDLNLAALSRQIDRLAAGGGDDSIGRDDLASATFTIVDHGSRSLLLETPRPITGQAGILAVGAVVERVVVIRGNDGERAIGIRPMVYLSLGYDDTLVDASAAARFLTAVKSRLQSGQFGTEHGSNG